METYLRFETAWRCPRSRRPLGVFYAAGELEDCDDLCPTVAERLKRSLDWFSENLIVPQRRLVMRRSVFWFRGSATDVIERIWELVAILDEEAAFVETRSTRRPGAITYKDEQQIAAIPNRR